MEFNPELRPHPEWRGRALRFDPQVCGSVGLGLRDAVFRLGVEGPRLGRRLRGQGHHRPLGPRMGETQRSAPFGPSSRTLEEPGICKIRRDLNTADASTTPKSLTELREIIGLVNVRLVAPQRRMPKWHRRGGVCTGRHADPSYIYIYMSRSAFAHVNTAFGLHSAC